MKIESHALRYYEWDDIEFFLCAHLGIPDDKFRDYHDLVGGKYKDWWHVWITLNYDNVSNDSFIAVYKDMILSSLVNDAVEEYGDWVLHLKEPLEQLFKTVGEDKIYVHYCW